MKNSIVYREDIDCLRGLSVLFVILYHLKISYFSGGFLGVDIFFVISGLLITSIILKDISDGTFSLISFYERRIRRIFPALFFVLIFTYLFFNFIYLEGEIKELSKSIISTILFYANFHFLDHGSYFSPANENLPLLHTWSLSIEEQFYFFFPFLIIFFKKNLSVILKSLIVLTFFSISLTQFGGNLRFDYPYIEKNFNFYSIPQFAFYFTFTRIWEILLGCILAIFLTINKKKLESKFFTLMGYLLIFFSIFYFDKNTLHPSLITLIPVIGTILILGFSSSSFNKKGFFLIINNSLFLKIGLISYSLYLWHQPIYQYFVTLYLQNFDLIDKIFIILFMIIISYLSFRFIEQPFRKKNFFNRKKIYIFYFLSSFFLISFCINSIFNKDFSSKYPNQVYEISSHSNYYISNSFDCSSDAEKYLAPKKACTLGNKERKSEIAFIGDSHLDLVSLEINKRLLERDISAIQYSYDGCVPSLNLKVFGDNRYKCNKFFSEVLDQIKDRNIKKVFLFSRWSFNLTGERFDNKEGGKEIGENHYFIPITENTLLNKKNREKLILENIEKFIDELNKENIEISIILPVPEMGWEIPNNLARQFFLKKKLSKDILSISKKSFDERNKKINFFFNSIEKNYNLNLISLEDLFCDDIRCYAHINNIPLYFDDDHMSMKGAELLSKKISKYID